MSRTLRQTSVLARIFCRDVAHALNPLSGYGQYTLDPEVLSMLQEPRSQASRTSKYVIQRNLDLQITRPSMCFKVASTFNQHPCVCCVCRIVVSHSGRHNWFCLGPMNPDPRCLCLFPQTGLTVKPLKVGRLSGTR